MAGNFKVLDLSSLRKALIFSSILHLNFNFSAFCLSSSLASYSLNTLINVHACKFQRPIKLWNAQYLLFLLHHFLLFRGWGWLWLVHGSHDAVVLKSELVDNGIVTMLEQPTKCLHCVHKQKKLRSLHLPRRSIMIFFSSSPSSSNLSHSHSPEKIGLWDESVAKSVDTEHWHKTTKIAISGEMCRN